MTRVSASDAGVDAIVTPVLRAAARIEPNPALVIAWYYSTPIAQLDHLTAADLIAAGRAEDVLKFLRGITPP